MDGVIRLFHDFTDPASAVAVARAQRLADEGLPIEFAGFEVVGVDAVLPVSLDVMARLDDLAAEAAAEGVVLRRPPAAPPTGWAHVLGTVAERAGLGASWRQTCYTAYWRDGADLSATDVLVDLAVAAGLEPAAATAAATDRAALAAFRRLVAGHRRAGVGGVPVLSAHQTLVPGLLPAADLRALAAL